MTSLYVAAGGAIGAVARYWMAGAVQRAAGSGGFPWGTLAVNVLGAFLMGLVAEPGAKALGLSAELRLFLATGILGGFTTFSAFSLEAALMLEKGQWGALAAYVSASVALTVLALFAGLWLIRVVVP